MALRTLGEGEMTAVRRRGWHNSCGLVDCVRLTQDP